MDDTQNGTNKGEIKKNHAIEAWKNFNGNITEICKEVGINRKTFYEWLKEEKFTLAIENEEQSLNDAIKSKLVEQALEGKLPAIKFYLEHKHPEFKPNPINFLPNTHDDMSIEFISEDVESNS